MTKSTVRMSTKRHQFNSVSVELQHGWIERIRMVSSVSDTSFYLTFTLINRNEFERNSDRVAWKESDRKQTNYSHPLNSCVDVKTRSRKLKKRWSKRKDKLKWVKGERSYDKLWYSSIYRTKPDEWLKCVGEKINLMHEKLKTLFISFYMGVRWTAR